VTQSGRSPALGAADRAAIEAAQALGREGAPAVPRLIEALGTPSWVVRREVVAQLAKLGPSAAAAMCHALSSERKGEGRLAALVDALVLSDDIESEQPVRQLLDSDNVAVLADALQILGRRRSKRSVARVIELASHADDNVAVASIEALGQIGGTLALECLLEVVKSAGFFRSFPAIDVLGRLGDTRAVEPLTGLLQDSLRGPEAARALGRLGDETAILPLLRMLMGSQAAGSRVAAVALAEIHERSQRRYGTSAAFERALAPHPNRDTLEARLERALSGADASEQRAIGALLGFFSSNASIESLRPLLDEAPAVAQAAAASLARLARLGNLQIFELLTSLGSEHRALLIPQLAGSSSAVPALVECLADSDPRVRILACDALAKTGDPSCAEALFELLGDADISIAQAATGALQALGSEHIEQLALAAAVGTPKSRRQPALRIVGHFGSQRGLAVLLDAATHADEKAREIAIIGLSNVGGEQARAALLVASHHESSKTRAAAIRGLGHLDETAETLERLRAATTDADAWVRYYACQALGNVGDAGAAELLSARAEDPAGQVRVAAIDALAKLSTEPALEVLGRAALHDDPELRRAALAGVGLTRKAALLPLLLDASYAPDTATRLVAVSGLANFPDEAALLRVCAIARKDPEPSLQNAAIELLADNTTPQATAALIALLSDDAHRARAVSALSRNGLSRTAALSAALSQASAEVAEALVTVMARLPSATAERLLLAALHDPSDQVRRAAVRALRFAFESEPANQALAHAASRDTDPEVRRIAGARLS
jgi:HEAT repeat protein